MARQQDGILSSADVSSACKWRSWCRHGHGLADLQWCGYFVLSVTINEYQISKWVQVFQGLQCHDQYRCLLKISHALGDLVGWTVSKHSVRKLYTSRWVAFVNVEKCWKMSGIYMDFNRLVLCSIFVPSTDFNGYDKRVKRLNKLSAY